MAALDVKEDRVGGHALAMRVCIVGARGVGKSSVVRGALKDIALLGVEPPEDADGLCQQRVLYEHRGHRVSLDLVEFPADNRYRPLLPQFACGVACVVFVVDLADEGGPGGDYVGDGATDARCPASVEEWMEALGRPPRCGLVVANSKTGLPAGADERARLAALQEVAAQWSLHIVRTASLDQLERSQILKTICTVVMREMPDSADPLHLLGTGVSRDLTPAS